MPETGLLSAHSQANDTDLPLRRTSWPGLRWLAILFTGTVFWGASLLFVVQPIFSKMVLPRLGGSAGVWNTCMLFFQTVLLLGYLYAHVATARLSVRRQVALHFALLAAVLLLVPFGISGDWVPDSDNPVISLLVLLTVTIGAPFFLLSSTGPMMQKWFARTVHPDAGDPYFLYAASNLGSVIGLLSYPFLVEPRLRLNDQTLGWAAGYGLLVALFASCAVLFWRFRAPERQGRTIARSAAGSVESGLRRSAPTLRERVRFVLLALVPSSLLLAVTTFLTTDVAPIPLLWVVPLALYLLTFVIAFSRRPLLSHSFVLRAHPQILIPLVIPLVWGIQSGQLTLVPAHLLVFFVTCLVCHGELARLRPPVSHLTEFYLWIAVGGMLGGAFNVLVAPVVFSTVIEYPLMLTAACFLRPAPAWQQGKAKAVLLDVLLPLALGLLVFAFFRSTGRALPDFKSALGVGFSLTVGVICFSFHARPVRFGLGIALALACGAIARLDAAPNLLQQRSFFGAHRVANDATGNYHLLFHGSTLHGAQSEAAGSKLDPLTYYSRQGPVGDIFRALKTSPGKRRVAIVGLGTGTTACHGYAGERWTYYEIDPVVEKIARNPSLFTFLRDCPPSIDVVLGDARISMRTAPAAAFDLIVLDAFSSDAIPTHLLTREAFAMYLEKLAPSGIVAVHISNRHLRLQRIMAALAKDAGISARWRRDRVSSDGYPARTPSEWVVLARNDGNLGQLAADPNWEPLPRDDQAPLWTDDFTNVLAIMRWR